MLVSVPIPLPPAPTEGADPPLLLARLGPADLAEVIAGDARLSGSSGDRVVLDATSRTIVVLTESADETTLVALRRQVDHLLPSARYVGFDTTTALIDRIVHRLGNLDLDALHLVGVPRGGLVVAGLLAYRLGVPAERVGWPADAETPVLLVDDIALTGHRVSQYLERLGPREVHVVSLIAPAPLTTALPNGVRLTSGAELPDRTEELGDDADSYRARWGQRSGGYWLGRVDHVVFAWSEPDLELRDPDTGTFVRGWPLAPHHLCVANRPSADPAPVLDCRPAPRLASGLVTADDGELTYVVGTAATGRAWSIHGSGRELFGALVGGASAAEAADRLVVVYEIDVETARRDAIAFEETLIANNVLLAG